MVDTVFLYTTMYLNARVTGTEKMKQYRLLGSKMEAYRRVGCGLRDQYGIFLIPLVGRLYHGRRWRH